MTTATHTSPAAKPDTSSKVESRKVKVRILDKEVQLGCAAGEEDALAQAAQYVDDSMRKFRYRSNTSTPEKIAIVTAINIANDLLKMRARSHAFSYAESDLHARLRKMQHMVETALDSEAELPAPVATNVTDSTPTTEPTESSVGQAQASGSATASADAPAAPASTQTQADLATDSATATGTSTDTAADAAASTDATGSQNN